MRFVARVADYAPDMIEHQCFGIQKWPAIVRITHLRLLVALENNKANPSLKTLEAIASVLGMEITPKVKEIKL